MTRKHCKEREGFFFALTLDRKRLGLRLLGILPVASIRLRRIRYIRQRGGGELFQLFRDSLRHPLRSWYWPRPGLARGVHHSAPFMVCMQSGRRIYLRLRPGFHHRLRSAVGEARALARDLAEEGRSE
jgi:hypothetical protein